VSGSGVLAGAVELSAAAVRMATPLLFAGLGEVYSERCGLLNIGLEAVMLTGAFSAFMVATVTGNPYLGVAGGALGGMLAALLHALVTVTAKADQTVAGLAMNFLASGVTSFAFLKIYGRTTVLPSCPVLPVLPAPLLGRLPVLGPVFFQQSVLVYLAYAVLIGSWIWFARTEYGTRMDAVGENPHAADSVGLSVARTQYLAAAANGLLGGIGGACITVATLGFFTENVTSGRGYIALVVVILGRRQAGGVFLAALMLGLADALQFRLQSMGSGIPSQVFIMFPYLATVVVLFISAGRARAPRSLGIPFNRRAR